MLRRFLISELAWLRWQGSTGGAARVESSARLRVPIQAVARSTANRTWFTWPSASQDCFS